MFFDPEAKTKANRNREQKGRSRFGESLGFIRWVPPVLVAMLGMAANGNATSFISRPFESILTESPLLIRGRAGSSEVVWIPSREGGRTTATITTFEIIEVLKASGEDSGLEPGSKILVRELGGLKDGEGMEIASRAQFSLGEEVVLTLREKDEQGYFPLIGLSTGRYSIEKRADGNEYLVGFGIEDGGQSLPDATGLKRSWTINQVRTFIGNPRGADSANPIEKSNLSGYPVGAPKVEARPSDGQQSLSEAPAVKSSGEGAQESGSASIENPGSIKILSKFLVVLLGAILGGVFYYFKKKK